MSRKTELPSTDRHIAIFDEDWELLRTIFGPNGNGQSKLSTASAIRAIVHQKCKGLRQQLIDRREAPKAKGTNPHE